MIELCLIDENNMGSNSIDYYYYFFKIKILNIFK